MLLKVDKILCAPAIHTCAAERQPDFYLRSGRLRKIAARVSVSQEHIGIPAHIRQGQSWRKRERAEMSRSRLRGIVLSLTVDCRWHAQHSDQTCGEQFPEYDPGLRWDWL